MLQLLQKKFILDGALQAGTAAVSLCKQQFTDEGLWKTSTLSLASWCGNALFLRYDSLFKVIKANAAARSFMMAVSLQFISPTWFHGLSQRGNKARKLSSIACWSHADTTSSTTKKKNPTHPQNQMPTSYPFVSPPRINRVKCYLEVLNLKVVF